LSGTDPKQLSADSGLFYNLLFLDEILSLLSLEQNLLTSLDEKECLRRFRIPGDIDHHSEKDFR
jgi:hypothetical protein